MDRQSLFAAAQLMRARTAFWALVPLASLLVCCEARHEPEGRVAKSPPFRIAPAVASAPQNVPSATFSLSDFRPLLTIPELTAVAAALDAGTPAVAARELANWLEKSPPPPAERFRYDFLLARLHEQAGEFAPALVAYGRVSQGSSSLAGYARVGEARALLALGRAKEVASRTAAVPDGEPAARLKWPVLAEAARVLGDRSGAIQAYEHVVQALPAGSERADSELRLATALLDAPAAAETERSLQILEALSLSRRIQNEPNAQRLTLQSAQAMETRALALLPEPVRAQHQSRDAAEELERVRALFDARHFADAEQAAQQSLATLPESERSSSVGCEIQFLLGKALSAKRAYARAGDTYEGLLGACKDPELRARAQFMAGKAAASDGQHMLAAKRFAALEQDAPKNSLADDARLFGALAYLEAGVEARFTELLNALPDDYPDGDMVPEGTFRLALRRMDKQDYQGAARVLERVLANKFSVTARAADFAGRERYFHARALAGSGDSERALGEYEALIRDLPLSYYMLSAYSALHAASAERARAVLASAIAAVPSGPVVVTNRSEFSGVGFSRALELFGVGDLENGARELDALGLADSSRPEILWGLSKLYAEAGSVKLSHAAARRALSAAPSTWPADAWIDAWKLAYPAPFQQIVQREAKRTGQNSALIYAIMREESAFDPDAVSLADAYGLMQLIVPTAKSIARPLGLPADRVSLKRPSVNIALGTGELARLANAFPENALLAIPAYNAGPGNPKRWLRDRPNADFDLWVELIPYVETRRYVKRVLSSRATYAFLYQRDEFEQFAVLPNKVQ
ncbi:MAG TPA: transglycosylase SLT domain-containing protein [Polyangiaceae bacterium]|nr:transglycosylase SLT domain-containing protein [Polyangiaceae bacterium]